ncbi:MAG: hypothetical protein ACI85F_001426 [Bacteroidia bacterium]
MILVIGILLVGINSCKKEDELRPEVTVNFPSDGATYHVKDTIRVGFEATDNILLESVGVKLLDSEGRLSSTSASAVPGSASYSGILSIILEDKYLETGTYSINVRASDGVNQSLAFVSVHLIAFPKNRRSIVALTNSGSAALHRVDSMGLVSPLSVLNHDGGEVCVNNRNDQAIVVGDIDGKVSSIDLLNGGLVWETTSPGQPPAPAFSGATCDGSDVLISGYNHVILGYNDFGSLIVNKEISATYRPEELIVAGEHLLVEQVQSGTTNYFMAHYNRASMALQNLLEVPMDVVSICPFNEESVLIFGNDNGQARVFQYSYFENVIWEPRTLEPGSVIDAVKSNGNTYFIAQSDGIYAYTFLPNFLNFIVPSVVSTGLKFDTDRGVLLSSSSNMIQEYTTAGTLITTHQFSEDVVSFDFHYTK